MIRFLGVIALSSFALIQSAEAQTPSPTPCNQTNLRKKSECLNQALAKAQASIAALQSKPSGDPTGTYLLKQERSGFCLSFGDNKQGSSLISFLTCDHPQDQKFILSR